MKQIDILTPANGTIENVLDTIPEKNNIYSIQEIENMTKSLIASLPQLNKEAIREEMSKMIVPMETNPSTFNINECLALTQGYRDRLAEIQNLAQTELKVRKRCMEMLFDAVNLVSKASSADKRRGEATMRYPIMVMQTEAADIFLKEVDNIAANMKSTFDAISRQCSVLALQVQLGERRQGNAQGKDFMQTNSEAEESNKELNWNSI